jgi:Zinc finger, C3HC4 type (RING finger)
MSSARVVRLVPIEESPDEQLEPGFPQRPVVVYDASDGYSLIVGRGSRTRIDDQAVTPMAFRLYCDVTTPSNKVLAFRLEGGTPLFINGLPWDEGQPKVHLGHDDIVSLCGEMYQYRVEIISQGISEKKRKMESPASAIESQDSESAWTAGSAASSSIGIAIPKESASGLADEVMCSVCLGIQVNPHTLNPCGHSFCGLCLQTLRQCPQCRQDIQSHIPAIQFGSLISTLVDIPDLFESDEIEHYKQRKAASCSSKKVCHTRVWYTLMLSLDPLRLMTGRS